MVASVHFLPVRARAEDAPAQSPGAGGEVIPFPLGLVRMPTETRVEWIAVRQAWLRARALARRSGDAER